MQKLQDYDSQVDIAGLQWFQWFAILLTLLTNGYMINFIMKQQSKTFLDWMIVFDSGLCINQCMSIAAIGSKIKSFCGFSVSFLSHVSKIKIKSKLISLRNKTLFRSTMDFL